MSRIKIKHFGPIKEGMVDNDGWIDIKKVTVFTGNQGSGKSTVAKVITTMTWLEKAINRGDIEIGKISHDDFFSFFKYMRTHNYFKDNSEIEYEGEKLSCIYNKRLNYPEINLIKNSSYRVPKIMYVPAERNFLSTIQDAHFLKNLPDSLYTFAEELRKSHLALNETKLELPLGDVQFRYDKKNEKSYLVGKDFELDITESSSGYQSLVPLYLVTKFLSDEIQKGENALREQLSAEQSIRRNKEVASISFDSSLTPIEKEIKFKEIDAKYLNTCFINIVEEPEQNLFPTSQKSLLFSLLEFNNFIQGNKLIITTHSPFLINYLAIAIEAGKLIPKDLPLKSYKKLEAIIPIGSVLHQDDLIIYELDETTGTIRALPTYENIPSDENLLNNLLGEGNNDFLKILEILQPS